MSFHVDEEITVFSDNLPGVYMGPDEKAVAAGKA